MIRAFAVEGRRLLRDRFLLACLALAVLPTASLLGSLPEGRRDLAAAEALRASFSLTLLANVVLIAAAFGALRTSTSFAHGLVARDVLAVRAGGPFWARAAASRSTSVRGVWSSPRSRSAAGAECGGSPSGR